MQEQITALETAVTTLSKELKETLDTISSGFKKVDNNFDSVKKEINSLHSKIDALHSKVEALKGDTKEGFGTVGMQLENLTEEITKIGKVTNYDEVLKNLHSIKN
jgi:archaellum component FlaC